MRLWRRQKLPWGDYWCVLAGFFIGLRLVANWYAVNWSTTSSKCYSNLCTGSADDGGLSEIPNAKRLQLSKPGREHDHLVVGSVATIVARMLQNCLYDSALDATNTCLG